jgi:hypothetical protein
MTTNDYHAQMDKELRAKAEREMLEARLTHAKAWLGRRWLLAEPVRPIWTDRRK